jgi:hypothetical protein
MCCWRTADLMADGPASGRLLFEVHLTKTISADWRSTDLSPAWLLVGP